MKSNFTFLFSLLIIVCSCNSKDMAQTPSTSISFLSLGDSYTIGQGVSEQENWPNLLSDQLNILGYEIAVPVIIAKTGWTTTDLLAAINAENPGKHDLVSLLIGVNNQYQNKPFDLFKVEFLELLDQAISHAHISSNVFVVSIPDYGVTPFGMGNATQIAEELDSYNAFMEETCNTRNIVFINITQISRDLESHPQALADDGLHPSGYQYSLWVEKMLPEIIELVN